MKKLSLNIKKIALSLLVVGLAVGTQAFKNAEKVESKGARFTTVWIVGFDGTHYEYTTVNPGASCSPSSVVPCQVSSPTYPLPAPGGTIPKGTLNSSAFSIDSERASY